MPSLRRSRSPRSSFSPVRARPGRRPAPPLDRRWPPLAPRPAPPSSPDPCPPGRRPAPPLDPGRRRARSRVRRAAARNRRAARRFRHALDVLRRRRAQPRRVRRARIPPGTVPPDRTCQRRPHDGRAGLVHAVRRSEEAHPARRGDLVGDRDAQRRRSLEPHVRDVEPLRLAQLEQRRRRARRAGRRRQRLRHVGGRRGGARARERPAARNGRVRLLRLRGARACSAARTSPRR